MIKQPEDGREKFYQPSDAENAEEKTDRPEADGEFAKLDFDPKDAPEQIKRLEAKMNEDMEKLLNLSVPVMPHHFSDRYEKKLKASLEEKFGSQKAEAILKARETARQAAEEEYKKFIVSNGILPDTYTETKASGHGRLHIFKHSFRRRKFSVSLKKSLMKLPKSNLLKAASAFILIIAGVLILGKNEANAYWWESIRFVINSYEEYSQLEAHKAVDKGDIEYPETIEKKYVPGKVAEGYEEVYREEMSKQIFLVFNNELGLEYTFTQQTQDISLYIDTEKKKYKECETIYGMAYYIEKSDYCKVIWNYEDYVFIIEGALTKEQIIDVANTLILDKGE